MHYLCWFYMTNAVLSSFVFLKNPILIPPQQQEHLKFFVRPARPPVLTPVELITFAYFLQRQLLIYQVTCGFCILQVM